MLPTVNFKVYTAWHHMHMQVPLQPFFQLEHFTFFFFFTISFFLPTFLGSSLTLIVFCFSCFSTPLGLLHIMEHCLPYLQLGNTSFLNISSYTILRATRNSSVIFISSICSFIENPDSTQVFPCEKKYFLKHLLCR